MTQSQLLLIGNSFAQVESIQSLQSELSQDNILSFEQPDRLSYLPKSKFHAISAGNLLPFVSSETNTALHKYFYSLLPNGQLHLSQLVMDEYDSLQKLKSFSFESISYTVQSLQSDLILCGFSQIEIIDRKNVSKEWLMESVPFWDIQNDSLDSFLDFIVDHGVFLTVKAVKPNYEIGSVAKLNFKSKQTVKPILQGEELEKKMENIKIWKISANDEDEEEDLEDEDALLDDMDKQKSIASRILFFKKIKI